MDYAELKTELLGDSRYAAMIAIGADADIALLRNSLTVQAMQPITVAQAMIWAASGPRAAMEVVAGTLDHPLRASVLTMLDMLKGGSEQLIHINDAAVAGMFAAWKTVGMITQGQYDALVATATVPVFTVVRDYGREITHDDVAHALRGNQ